MITIGKVLRSVDFMCDPCMGAFEKFSEENCFEDSNWCGKECVSLMYHLGENCDSSHTFMAHSVEESVLESLAPIKAAMGFCEKEECGAKMAQIQRKQAMKFGLKGCEA